MNTGEKLIPATDPENHHKLPDGWTNSLVDTGGARANTYNDWAFDEKDDNREETSDEAAEALKKARELAEFARDKAIIYTGFFINPGELLEKHYKHNNEPLLDNAIKDPHVTIAFRPKDMPLITGLLETLNPGEPESEATIKAVGYANDGKNQGYLVEVETENVPVGNYLKSKHEKEGESPDHITIAVSEDGKPVDTGKLDFKPLPEEKQFFLPARLGIFTGEKGVVYDRKTIEEMKKSQSNQ